MGMTIKANDPNRNKKMARFPWYRQMATPSKSRSNGPYSTSCPSQRGGPPKTKKATSACPKSVPEGSRWDDVGSAWFWQDTDGRWHSYDDGWTMTGTEPSWARADCAKAERAEAEQQKQARLVEQAAAEKRAAERETWKLRHGW